MINNIVLVFIQNTVWGPYYNCVEHRSSDIFFKSRFYVHRVRNDKNVSGFEETSCVGDISRYRIHWVIWHRHLRVSLSLNLSRTLTSLVPAIVGIASVIVLVIITITGDTALGCCCCIEHHHFGSNVTEDPRVLNAHISTSQVITGMLQMLHGIVQKNLSSGAIS